MTNFNDQMAMFAYLRTLYPKVRLSAHAGELAPGLVPPEGLRNHIRDTVMIAKAGRRNITVAMIAPGQPPSRHPRKVTT